jgi:hypothetical protein
LGKSSAIASPLSLVQLRVPATPERMSARRRAREA